MRHAALRRLLETARSLPGEGGERGGRPLARILARWTAKSDASNWDGWPKPGPKVEAAQDLQALRHRLGMILGELALRLEPALGHALAENARAWDQVDDLTVIDEPLRRQIEELRAEVAALPETEAARSEALLALGTAVTLVELLERRLAALVRLRLRSGEPALLVEGRPFLDVSAALAEAARGWA